LSNTEFAGFRLRFFTANQVIKGGHTVPVLYEPKFRLPSNTALNFYSSYHHRNEAYMCQSDPVLLYARFSPRVTQINRQPTRREHVENVFNAYNSIKNRPYRVLCPIFPASSYYEKK